MNRPLNILMVLHIPWSRNLGGSRVQLELAEEFRYMGHVVEKFDYHDAFPNANSSKLAKFIRPHFSIKARAFVKANAHRFDIIDAHQGNLPFSKQELGFKGLLVTRSVGLYAFYQQFSKQDNQKYPPQKIKTRLGNLLRNWQYRSKSSRYVRSFQTSDLINLPNHDEFDYVRDLMGLCEKSVVFPFGLSSKRVESFLQTIKPVKVRLVNKQIVFIGSWGPRKGSRDWRKIITDVRKQVPEVRFLFLGTGLNPEVVLNDLGLPKCDWIEIIPRYENAELPKLLSGATVGAFPSYMEGFGFAVLEKLACGIPTVAYNVPGPREMLPLVDNSLLIEPSDTEKFSQRLVKLVNLDVASYSLLSQRCLEVAQKFSWSKVAKETLDIYSKFLDNQK